MGRRVIGDGGAAQLCVRATGWEGLRVMSSYVVLQLSDKEPFRLIRCKVCSLVATVWPIYFHFDSKIDSAVIPMAPLLLDRLV